MTELQVTKSGHGMFCIEGLNLQLHELLLIRLLTTSTYIDSENFKLSRQAGAFLQGYDEKSGWILVEFWSKNFKPFVDYVNEQLKVINTKCYFSTEVITKNLTCSKVEGFDPDGRPIVVCYLYPCPKYLQIMKRL
jgi:hypothetical protein